MPSEARGSALHKFATRVYLPLQFALARRESPCIERFSHLLASCLPTPPACGGSARSDITPHYTSGFLGSRGLARHGLRRRLLQTLLHRQLSAGLPTQCGRREGNSSPPARTPSAGNSRKSDPKLRETLEALCAFDSKRRRPLPRRWEGAFSPNKGQDPNRKARNL